MDEDLCKDLQAANERIAELEEGLQWYLGDDNDSVEQGILESAQSRPAWRLLNGLDSGLKKRLAEMEKALRDAQCELEWLKSL